MNEYHQHWLNLIYERDQFYLYLAIAVAALFLWYRMFRISYRLFKLVVAVLIVLALAGIVWGLYQLPITNYL